MNVAILGADDCILELAREAVSRADFELVYLCELDTATDPASAAGLRALNSGARILETWEGLLDPKFVDAVFVARGPDDERREDQLRKLVQAGVPVVCSHPIVGSMLLNYELDMIRRENAAIVLPHMPARLHPAITEAAEILRNGENSPIGRTELVQFERQMADRDKQTVIKQFARDIDLLRKLCGELTQIGAMGVVADDSAYGNLNVQLTGPAGVAARWNVGPIETGTTANARLTLFGIKGKAIFEMPGNGRPWTLSIDSGPSKREFPNWNPAAATLDQLSKAIRNERTEPDLLDAARSTELAETIARSLARRRTIDLHYENHSEENTFKSKMAAGGCLLLMGTLFALFVVTISQATGLTDRLAALLDQVGIRHFSWPKMLAATLGLFVALQLLTLAFRRDKK